MGNFYVNHTVRAPQNRVIAVLEKHGHTAFVSPTADGYTVVFDQQCDTQDTFAIAELGQELSAALNSPVVAFLNHDDDILCYWLFERGEPVEAYNSCPDYFEDDASGGDSDEDEGQGEAGPTSDGTELCRVFRPGVRDRVRSILAEPSPMFASMTHHDLVSALGLPTWTVGTGYRYLAEGDSELNRDRCVHVNGRPTGGLRVHSADGDEE
jgi:hypothetical protein